MPVSNEFGFKRLTAANWLTVDPIWQGFLMSSSLPDPSSDWVDDLTRFELDPAVPSAIRKLFEIGRGTLAYSLMFYPLLTLGTEQIFRVLETSAAVKCEEIAAPSRINSFKERIEWLREHGAISEDCLSQWEAVRHLRNEASHPKDQSIISPGMAVMTLNRAVNLINSLFR
jgi:hypothetical protein